MLSNDLPEMQNKDEGTETFFPQTAEMGLSSLRQNPLSAACSQKVIKTIMG
jgi:hypothetical protein